MLRAVTFPHIRPVAAAFMILWICATSVWPALANDKMQELERNITDLDLLDRRLEDRMRQVREVQISLNEQEQAFAAEVRVLVASLKIKTLPQAHGHLRIRHNISLLGIIGGHNKQLDEKLALYRSGREKLSYLRRLAEDDKRMLAALHDLKIEGLTHQIAELIQLFLPEAAVIRIEQRNFELLPAQSVWERLNAGLRPSSE
jgi:hypothetical protein